MGYWLESYKSFICSTDARHNSNLHTKGTKGIQIQMTIFLWTLWLGLLAWFIAMVGIIFYCEYRDKNEQNN